MRTRRSGRREGARLVLDAEDYLEQSALKRCPNIRLKAKYAGGGNRGDADNLDGGHEILRNGDEHGAIAL